MMVPPMNAKQALTILERMRVPGWTEVYALGCIDHRVTLYSQQVRALNLAAALVAKGSIRAEEPVIIIGAGAAGLTCAAGLRHLGVDVIVFEQREKILPLFDGGSSRWLHPRVYDWPFAGWDQGDAELPLLTWRHDTVGKVRDQLTKGWEAAKRGATLHLNVKEVTSIGTSNDSPRTVFWNPGGEQRTRTLILAVGFGFEAEQPRYWEGDDLDADPSDGGERKWLVSGSGDGGLTDLLRLCIAGFRHDRMVQEFATNRRMDEVRARILEIENDPKKVGKLDVLHNDYLDLDAPWVQSHMKNRRRIKNVVWLATETPNYLGGGASPLNRFLVSQLRKAGIFEPIPSPVVDRQNEDKKTRIRFANAREDVFDRVVIRHGPAPAMRKGCLKEIDHALAHARSDRRSNPISTDQTRERFWVEGTFGPEPRSKMGESRTEGSADRDATPATSRLTPEEVAADSLVVSTGESGATSVAPLSIPGSISARLDAAYMRREELAILGEDTAEVDSEIRQLRREQRSGPTLHSGEFLDDGRFRLIDVIGRGGFATVWKAYDRQGRQLVAIKVLHGEFARDSGRRERFFRGARRMTELQHSCIVRVLLPEGEDQYFCYFVMEYVSGGDLYQAIAEKILGPDEGLAIVESIAGALEHAHERGLVHRDVKPQNILIRENGTPALTDFDLVQAVDTTGGTRTGALGTVAYSSPEQNDDASRVDHRTDIYSLGMTALFCIYGKKLPQKVMFDRETFLEGLNCTGAFRTVLRKAIEIARGQRFQRMEDFRRALSALRSHATIESSGYAPAVEKFAEFRSQNLQRLIPPRRFGKFYLAARRSKGSVGTVYVAVANEGSVARLSALKLLPQGVPDQDFRKSFLEEAKVLLRLRHNNIVDVRDVGEVGGKLFIETGLIDGRDLEEVWDRCAEIGRAFPVPLAVYIVREALRGLHYVHTFPGFHLVHGQISESNILIDWAGAVHLTDFSLVLPSVKASFQIPNMVRGKVQTMSPEQATLSPLDGRADVYGCGVLLWQLLTGRPLRDLGTTTIEQVAGWDAVPPSSLAKRVDDELDDIVITALQRSLDDRYQSAGDFMEALSLWLSEHAPDTTQERMSEFMNRIFGDAPERDYESYSMLIDHLANAPTQNSSGDTTASDAAEPSNVDVETLTSGTIIAQRYRIAKPLGGGSLGIVYLAEHVTVGRKVVIKVLTQEWSEHEITARRFREEAQAASAAGHPNIVEVFDAGELPDGRLFMVMEFLTGCSLHEELHEKGAMDVLRACRIVRDVARAIRAAHGVGIIHRDLKPDNIMLVNQGEDEMAKVFDFGIAANTELIREKGRLTAPGYALGTPEYMAPEQSKGHPPTELFDIYALGVILYETLAGEPPFVSENVVEVLARKATEAPLRLETRRPGLPPRLVHLVHACIEIDPSRRPSSTEAFLAELEAVIIALENTQVIDISTPVVHSVDALSRKALWVVTAVGVPLGLLIGVWWQMTCNHSP